MSILDLCIWLEATPFATAIGESDWMFPAIETLHVLALTLVIGTIAMLDLRLVGASSRNLRVMQLSNETLPWTWMAFVAAAITGTAMFASHATKYYGNVPFRIKMVLLVLAGINMAVFHFGAWKAVHVWDSVIPTPRAARIAGGLSLMFWIGVVFAGRWVGFVD